MVIGVLGVEGTSISVQGSMIRGTQLVLEPVTGDKVEFADDNDSTDLNSSISGYGVRVTWPAKDEGAILAVCDSYQSQGNLNGLFSYLCHRNGLMGSHGNFVGDRFKTRHGARSQFDNPFYIGTLRYA